jgi:hypothetical protein
MSFQEKRAIVSLISTTLVSALYFASVYQRYSEGLFAAGEEFRFWATAILLFIPVQVVAKVVVHVIFVVINVVATREEEPKITDELDKLIDLKATRNFYHVFMAGFLLSIAALVLSLPPLAMFVVLTLTLVMAGAVLDLSQVYYYRRGV